MTRQRIVLAVLLVALACVPVRAQSSHVAIVVLVTELGVPLPGIPVQLIPGFQWQWTDAGGTTVLQASRGKGAFPNGSVYVVVVRSIWWMTIVDVPLGDSGDKLIKVHVETGPNLREVRVPE